MRNILVDIQEVKCMGKKIVAVILSVALSMPLGTTVMAQEDNSKRIAEIEVQIAELQAELKKLKGEDAESDVLYQDALLTITYDGMKESNLGYKVNFVIENTSDQKLTVQVRDTSINGVMIDPMCSIEVAPGKKAKDGFTVFGEDAEGTPMEDVENIETKFHIIKGDGFSDFYDTESIVIK